MVMNVLVKLGIIKKEIDVVSKTICKFRTCKSLFWFYLSVQSSLRPQLYQACNRSATWQYAFAAPNMTFQCNTACERVECKPGYRPEKTQCGKLI